MRLHSLEMHAFGPFGDTVRVDFDTLGADGLFLLHGRTGAGKTTVLDGVAFALFGTVPGARREGKRLLSDHAPSGAVPRVQLEATVGGRRVRLERRPEFTRPKKRGTGTITENAKATLEWLDGSGENLSRIPDIADEVSRLLGMSADQFFQVVLLPQGEFARFLRADNDERGVLLERLFDTTRFGRVEDWFVGRRRASAASLAEATRDVELLEARIAAASGIEAGADAAPGDWAEKVLADAREVRERTAGELTDARGRAAGAREAYERAKRIAELHARRDRAAADLADWEAAAERRAALDAELAAARRAEPVADAVAESVRVSRDAEDSRGRAADCEARFVREPGAAGLGASAWPPSPEDRERLRAAVRSWTDELVRLDALAADEGRARDLARTVAAGTERLDAIAREAEAVETELAGLPERLARARADVDDARNAAATLDAASAAREAAADRVSASEQWRARSAERAGVAEDVHRAEARHLDARAHRLDLTERRITGMAAELAAALVPGEPCGVCGAREHPEPAQPTGDPVTDAQERAAVDAEKARAEEADAVRMRLAELDRALDVLAARGGDGDPSELADLLATADAALADLRTRAGRLDELLARVAELDVADTRLTARLAELTAERATLTERIGSAETERERIAETLTRAAGDDGTVAARRTRVDALAVAGANLLEVRDDAVRAGERAVDATARAARLAAEAGFADLEAAGAAVRSADRRDEIVAILDGARADEAAARAVLAEDAVREAAEIEVDVAAAEAVAAAASRDAELAVAAASDADRRVADLERYAAKLAAALTRLEPIRAEHDELAALADVVAGRGSNSRRMSLRSYVLAARLEEVAVAASSRLRRMSNGRYEFVHSDDAGPRGKRGGLGLDIRDDFTGVVRSAKTLSGGESFVASLSLALGLADVVAAESGGVVLDTLFIDEGFGTLDADTLDQVMAVLDELRDGGRVVGIVSHVDEMRQRIPNRLHVVHGRAGSTLEMIAG